MITIYTIPGCPVCRKAVQYAKAQEWNYQERNLYAALMEEEGTVLADAVKKQPELQYLETMAQGVSFGRFLAENPSVLPRPLILSDASEKAVFRSSCPLSCPLFTLCLHPSV